VGRISKAQKNNQTTPSYLNKNAKITGKLTFECDMRVIVAKASELIENRLKRKIVKGGFCKMKIRPLNDRVLVIREDEEQKSAGGIVIPDTAKEKPQRGKIVSVGPGKFGEDGKRTPMEVKAGDRILFSKYAGMEIKIDGVEHIFMREDDILSIIE
jgi:chaperonin GroES